MNILIININIEWVFKLYGEYILSIKTFIKKCYNDITIHTLYYDVNTFNTKILNTIDYDKYQKILYCGNIDILDNILQKINNNYKKLYYINIEQLSHKDYFNVLNKINKNISIIDYSEENVKFLQNNYKYFLFPPFYYVNNEHINKTIDVLSICNNSYREMIFNKINVNAAFKKMAIKDCYDKIRDDLFDKTKIYINIHCSDNHNTMELIRIVNLICKKVIVISQQSICSELLFFKDYIIICNSPELFSEYVDEILNNYEKYYYKIYNDFDKKYNEYINYIKQNVDTFIKS